MEHGFDHIPVRVEETEQILRRDDVSQFALGYVAPLLSGTEHVANHNIPRQILALAQRGDQVRSDKSGAAGDDNHVRSSDAATNRPTIWFSSRSQALYGCFSPGADCFRKLESSRSGAGCCLCPGDLPNIR